MAVKASATITLTSYRDTQSVTRYYKLQPAGSSAPLKPETKPPSSDWTDSEPACDISKELYFCDLTIFSNGEWEYSKVSKSTSYEAAKQAYNKAQNASETLKAESARIDNLETGKVDTSVYNTKMEQLDNSISLKATATDVYTKTQANAAFDAKGSAATAKSEAISSANSYTDTATTDMATEEFVTSQGYLTVTSDAITSKVSKNEVISAINQTAESVSINANKISLTGAVTFSSFDNSLQTTINNKAETSALEDVRTIANNAKKSIDNLELTKIDRFGTNASMKWDGNILKIEAVDPETNVPYAVEIGGNGIEFKYDSEAVAMINQDQLVIDKTVVLTEMQVNRYWTWRTRDNNNLCLQWIGGSN